jgi:hypothetical protein
MAFLFRKKGADAVPDVQQLFEKVYAQIQAPDKRQEYFDRRVAALRQSSGRSVVV